MKGLIRCFEIKDRKERGAVAICSITLLFREANDPIFYKHIDNFEAIFEETINTILRIPEKEKAQIKEVVEKFQSNLNHLLKELRDSEIIMHKTDSFPMVKDEKKEIKGYRFKIIVCGDPYVGKTSTILKFTDRAFRRNYIPTMGVNISEKRIRYDKKTIINFTIWDIAGQSKFQMSRKHFYKGARGQLLVFDLTRPETFNNIVKWYYDIKIPLKKDIQGILLGNKCDLVDQRKVSQDVILKLSNELGIIYFETSALTGKNIDVVFKKLGKLLLKKDKGLNSFDTNTKSIEE
ncbi:MAG: Rab family GTPase [Promethearchaeota archaeon]